jgi:putative DNA primase/helicase
MADPFETIAAIFDAAVTPRTAEEICADIAAATGRARPARKGIKSAAESGRPLDLPPSAEPATLASPAPPAAAPVPPNPPTASPWRPRVVAGTDGAEQVPSEPSQTGGSPESSATKKKAGAAAEPKGKGDPRPQEARRARANAKGIPDPLDLRLARFPQTDLGNAERFVERNRGKFLWCPGLGWLWWDGKRWCRDGADEHVRRAEHTTVRAIQDEAEALAESGNDLVHKVVNSGKDNETVLMLSDLLSSWGRASEQASRLSPISKHAGPYLCVGTGQLDADPFKINVNNGTLIVRRVTEGEYITFRPHDPDDLITKLAPVDYDPQAECPEYDAFLAYVQQKEDMRRFLHQWGGLSLTGDTSEQKFVFFWGKGKNGKSTLLAIWCYVAGDYSRTVPIETFINEGRARAGGQATPDLAMLQGRRMVAASEPERGAKLSEALIKLMTGGDTIQVRHLNEEFFDLVPQFKLIMSGNYKPQVQGADEGIWRRMRLVPWVVTVSEAKRDNHLGDKLKREASGILNRLLDGLRDWLDNGLVFPDDVINATAEYRSDSDPLGRFIDACVIHDAGGRIQASEFHQVFVAWARCNGATEWTAKGLASALKERGYESKHSNVNYWLNVKLTKSVNDFVDMDGKPLRQSDRKPGGGDGDGGGGDGEPGF